MRVYELEEPPFARHSGGVVEVPLLLSAGDLSALEEAAHQCGLTAGEMLRALLHHYLAQPRDRSHLVPPPADRALAV
jgi:hypothetical protein